MEIVRVTKYCSKCRKKKDSWYKSIKPYVVYVTGGTGYWCLTCTDKYKEENK